jgi:hypothetical protein
VAPAPYAARVLQVIRDCSLGGYGAARQMQSVYLVMPRVGLGVAVRAELAAGKRVLAWCRVFLDLYKVCGQDGRREGPGSGTILEVPIRE